MLAERVDVVLKALADPTRRQVVERLAYGPAATSVLAEPFAMAMPSFLQHLAVLDEAGLITSSKHGRVRTYRLSTTALDTVETWLTAQRRLWETRLDQLDQFLLNQKAPS